MLARIWLFFLFVIVSIVPISSNAQEPLRQKLSAENQQVLIDIYRSNNDQIWAQQDSAERAAFYASDEQGIQQQQLAEKLTQIGFLKDRSDEPVDFIGTHLTAIKKTAYAASAALASGCSDARALAKNGVRFNVLSTQNEQESQVWWFRFSVEDQQAVELNTHGSTLDTQLEIYEHCFTDEPLHQNDDFLGLNAFVAFESDSRRDYWAKVTVSSAVAGRVVLSVREHASLSNINLWDYRQGTPPWLHFWNQNDEYRGSVQLNGNGFDAIYVPTSWQTSRVNRLLNFDQRQLNSGCLAWSCEPISEWMQNQQQRMSNNTVADSYGNIVGQVLSSESGQGINARVTAVDQNGSVLATMLTTNRGDYRFNRLDAEQIHIIAEAPGFLAENEHKKNCSYRKNNCQLNSTELVTLKQGDLVEHTTRLQGQSTIAGTVLDAESRPRGFAGIALYNAAGELIEESTADYQGNYVVSTPAFASYAIVASSVSGFERTAYPAVPCRSGACIADGAQLVTVGVGQNIAGVDIALPRTALISGRVFYDTGMPAGSASVSLLTPEGVLRDRVRANGRGYWFVRSASNEPLIAVASDFDHVSVMSGGIECPFDLISCDFSLATSIESTPNGAAVDDVDFVLRRQAFVAGTAKNSAGEVVRARVVAVSADGNILSFGFGDEPYRLYVPSNTQFYVKATSGDYKNRVYPDVECVGSCDITNGTSFMLSTSEVITDVDFELSDQDKFSGRIIETNGAAIGNQSLSISLYDVEGSLRITYTARTDANGNYELPLLQAGRFHVLVRDEQHYKLLYPNSICEEVEAFDCDFSNAEAIEYTGAGDIDQIDFELTPGARVNGRISSDGRRLRGIAIHDSSGRIRASHKRGDGQYSIPVTTSGTHYFSYQTELSALGIGPFLAYQQTLCARSIFISDCITNSATPVEVPFQGSVDGIDFNVNDIPELFIGGVVRDANRPDRSIIFGIDIYDETGVFVTSFQSNFRSGSRYHIGPVNPGKYYIVASSRGLESQVYPGVPCGNICEPRQGKLVEITSLAKFNLDFDLQSIGSISGRVVDSNNDPISSASVRVVRPGAIFSTQFSLTNGNGEYDIPVRSFGEYVVTVGRSSYINQLYDGIVCEPCDTSLGEVFVFEGGNTSYDNINFRLEPSIRVVGSVTNLPITSAAFNDFVNVRLLDEDGRQQSFDRIFLDRPDFNLPVNQAGVYYLHLSGNGISDTLYDGISCDDLFPSIDCDLTSGVPLIVNENGLDVGEIEVIESNYGVIQGQVIGVDSTQPDNISISLYSSFGAIVSTIQLAADVNAYEFRNVPSGDYYVGVRSDTHIEQFYNLQNCSLLVAPLCDLSSLNQIQLAPGENRSNVDFNREPNLTVSINLLLAGSGALVPGSSSVSLYDSNASLVQTIEVQDGQGVFHNIPHGSYYLTAFSDQEEYAIAALYNARDCVNIRFNTVECDVSQGTVFNVLSDQENHIDFTVNPLAKLTVNLSSSNGANIDGGSLILLDESGVSLSSKLNPSINQEEVFRFLPAGSYYVYMSESERHLGEIYDGSYCSEQNSSQCDLAAATVIAIDYEDEVNIDFQVNSGGKIIGQVNPSDDSVYFSSRVMLLDEEGEVAQSVFALANTEVRFENVYPGRYYIRASDRNHFLTLAPEAICRSMDLNDCNLSEAELFEVGDAGDGVAAFSLLLRRFPRVQGTITPLPGREASMARVVLHPVETGSGFTGNVVDNTFALFPNKPGEYYLYAVFQSAFGREAKGLTIVYPGVDCVLENPVECAEAVGEPITVGTEDISNIHLTYTNVPEVSFEIRDAAHGRLVEPYNTEVYFYDRFFNLIEQASIQGVGAGTNRSLSVDLAGPYYLYVEHEEYGHVLYPDVLCAGDFFSCDFSHAELINLEYGPRISQNIDLSFINGISGRVFAFPESLGIPGVEVDIWNQDGVLMESLLTSDDGSFRTELDDGLYFVSTNIGSVFTNEIYDDIPCEAGSAINGDCPINSGTLIDVDRFGSGTVPEVINIEMYTIDLIFGDNFESR